MRARRYVALLRGINVGGNTIIPMAALKAAFEHLGVGTEPGRYRYDVIFLKKPLTPHRALKVVEVKEGVDTAAAGRHTLALAGGSRSP